MPPPAATVRDATFDVLRAHGLTTLFANPGSTEVALLGDLPGDLRFVLGLHEGAVVGMATGWAIGRDEPALAILHTTAGLGLAVAALATARVNRAPLVVLVGQQDRRHLPFEPFLAGRLRGLAGEYPVSVEEPALAQDVPGAVARAVHAAVSFRGPALVVVPMDDWLAPADVSRRDAAAARVVRARAVDEDDVAELRRALDEAGAPALVVGADAADPDTWEAVVALAERLAAPVFQECFGARPGFPQDHPLFAGHLPIGRAALRGLLSPYDTVLAVGAPVFRQYVFEPGELAEPGTRLLAVVRDPVEAHRSSVELALVACPAAACAALARSVRPRQARPAARTALAPLEPPPAGRPLRAGHLLDGLAARLPPDVVLLEETPSSRPELNARLPARTPLGFVSAAMGGLGFALPAAVGLRMALPDRPVVAVVGDGASLYGIHAAWSAAHYRAGPLFVVLSNGGYAIMDRLAELHGSSGPWPSFAVDVAATARALGCEAARVETHAELERALDEALTGRASSDAPFLLEVVVEPDERYGG